MGEHKPTTQMRAVTYRQFAAEEDATVWLIPDLLPDFGWTLFIGAEGSGKTTFCLQLCQALDEGTIFLGKQTTKTKTLYIQADSSPKEWRQIIKLIAPKGIGFTIVNVADGCLSNREYVAQLNDLINEKVKPEFVVWDSLYNLSGTSLNGEHALTPIQTMRHLCGHRPWLLIHHPPHEDLRSAGSRAIPANASRVWLLRKNKLEIAKGRLTALKEVNMHRAEDDKGGLWSVDDSTAVKKAAITKKYPSLGVNIDDRL